VIFSGQPAKLYALYSTDKRTPVPIVLVDLNINDFVDRAFALIA
jgi:hypothetical protein